MPNSGYFDVVFGVSGSRSTVPDAVQPDGTVSYTQGYGPDYTLQPGTPGSLNVQNYEMNQLFYDMTSAIQQYQQNGIPPFITSAMNNGSPFSYAQYAMVLYSGVAYQSLTSSNMTTPPSASWAVVGTVGQNLFIGGTTTGSANAQVLASLSPASGFSLSNNGATVICTAGFTNTGSATLAITSPSISATTIYKNSPSGPIVLTGGEIVAGATLTLTVNTTIGGFVLTSAAAASGVAVPSPGGRLTLSSTAAVQASDLVAQTSIYYLPYLNSNVPVFDGTKWGSNNVGVSGVSLALDSNSGHTGYQQSGKLFDIFYANVSGTLYFGTGPAWSSSTARGTGAGTTEIGQRTDTGLWVNANAMILRFGSSSGNTISVPLNQATYLGTMYATANGQTGVALKPSAASGGSNNIIGLWNAYNRTPVVALEADSTSSWSYGSVTWRQSNNSAGNRISMVDGLAQSNVDIRLNLPVETSATSDQPVIGVNLNATTGAPNKIASAQNTGQYTSVTAFENFYPSLGFNYYQAMEAQLTGGTGSFQGNTYMQFELKTEI